jgi:predicted ferric reductase
MIAAVATPPFVWYLMRGSGLVALVLLTVTAVLGVLGVSRWRSPRWPAFVTAGLHRSISLLAVSFLGIHVLTAVADQWIGLSWYQAVIPFGATYRPVWLGIGALSLDLLVAVVVTSLLRKRIGQRAWRAVHWSAWMMWPLAAVHAVGAGTDMGRVWGFGPWAACVSALALAAVARLRRARRGTPAPATAGRPVTSGRVTAGP